MLAVGLIAATTDEQYDAVMNANAMGTFIAIREAARRLNGNGPQNLRASGGLQ